MTDVDAAGGPGQGLDERWLTEHLAAAADVDEFAADVGDAIRSGRLAPGTRLPTIRAVAAESGLTFRAVSEAWTALRDRGLIETRRRGGTVVAGAAPIAPQPAKRAAESPPPIDTHWDLSASSADPALLPDLAEALSAGLTARSLHSSVREQVTARLRDAASDGWPFEPELVTSGGSGAEAALLAVEAATPPGGTIAVDEPVNPGFLGHLRDLGLTAIGVSEDAGGPDPESLRRALEAGADSWLFQAAGPWAMRGHADAVRLAELADVLRAHPHVLVVEDDPIGPLAAVAAPTLGDALPGRVLRVRSFCRAYGVDLRTSVTGGPAPVIERLRSLRSHGLAVNSRILQDSLAHLLQSPGAAAVVHEARDVYAARRTALAAALHERGVESVSGPNGQFLWVSTRREADTLIDLAAAGITAGAGSRSFVRQPSSGFVRLATMRLPDDPRAVRRIARLVAEALQGRLGESYA